MLINLQALRAIAAFLVVFVHLKALAVAAGLSATLLDFGNCGVDLFFVISGLIMVITTDKREVTARSFLLHRIARIVPFYWAVTGLVVLVGIARPDLMASTRIGVGEVIRSLAFVPYQKSNGAIAPIVFVGWSLNYEMAFYGLFALSMLVPNRRQGLAIAIALLAIDTIWGFWANPRSALGAFYSSSIVMEFGLGMGLGVLLPSLPRSRVAALIALPVAAAALVALVGGSYFWPALDRLAFAGAPATLVVGSAIIMERGGLKLQPGLLSRLGDASYAIYLTHFFATQIVMRIALGVGVHGWLTTAAAAAVALVTVGVLGMVTHYWAEKPLSRLARNVLMPAPSSIPRDAPSSPPAGDSVGLPPTGGAPTRI